MATFYIDAMNGFRTAERNRTGNQRYLSTTAAALFSKGKAHFAGRIIADETYRVNLFVGWSGCNHNLLAFQIGLIAFFFLAVFYFIGLCILLSLFIKESVKAFYDDVRFFHASLSFQSACQESYFRFYDVISVAQECFHVGLGRRMLIHVEVHGWSDENRRFHRQIGCDEHVVSNSVSHLSHGRGCAGSDEHGVCPQT